MEPRPSHYSGNVLFMILLAVALFAALSYAVTNSTRTSSGNHGEEGMRAEAGSLLNYTSSLRATILRMSFNGVAGNAIMYNNDIYKNYNGVIRVPMPVGPIVMTSYLFHNDGGGHPVMTFPRLSERCAGASCSDTNTTHHGHGYISYVNVPNIGTTLPDIVFILFSLSEEGCRAVNKILGISDIPSLYVATGLYQTNSSILPVAPAAPTSRPDVSMITDKTEFCYRGVASSGANTAYNAYYFLSVLWPL